MNAWICPKCGRVWGPLVMECHPCNAPVITTTGTAPPPHSCDCPPREVETCRAAFGCTRFNTRVGNAP